MKLAVAGFLIVLNATFSFAFAGGEENFKQPECPEGSAPAKDLFSIPPQWRVCRVHCPDVEFWCEKDGVRRGEYRRWTKSDYGWYYLAEKGKYNDRGQKVGGWREYHQPENPGHSPAVARSVYYDDNGVPKSEKIRDETGAEIESGPLDELGQRHGNWESEHDPCGPMRYVHGKREGRWRWGEQCREFIDFKDGKCDGEFAVEDDEFYNSDELQVSCIFYSSEDEPACRGQCKSGKAEGIVSSLASLDEDEEPDATGPFKNGKAHGCNWEIAFDEYGKGCMVEGHQNGEWLICEPGWKDRDGNRAKCYFVTYRGTDGPYWQAEEVPDSRRPAKETELTPGARIYLHDESMQPR